jgi:hypothetical protein
MDQVGSARYWKTIREERVGKKLKRKDCGKKKYIGNFLTIHLYKM